MKLLDNNYHVGMKTHLILIGFSCTGKTTLGKEVFGKDSIIDSDEKVREWIGAKEGRPFDHVYEVYMRLGRPKALRLIDHAENALIDVWAGDTKAKVISVGPAFPLRKNWPRLRDASYVVLFRKSAPAIYEDMKDRRRRIFESCPDAKNYDNWDVGVMVDELRQEFSQDEAIRNILDLLAKREQYYRHNNAEVVTDNREAALKKLNEIKLAFEGKT
jgi:shikimate kinase